MRVLTIILLILPSIFYAQSMHPMRFQIRQATKKDLSVCPHSRHTVSHFTPRQFPEGKSIRRSKSVNFVATYNNVPDNFRNTVEFVFDVLEDYLTSDIPINVFVDYRDLGVQTGGGLTLAQAGSTAFPSNFPGTAYFNTGYPIALAEKLAGREFNASGAPDINITINSNTNVSFNVTPNNENIGTRSDLATVLLHEVIHGLGFVGGSGYDEAEDLGLLSEAIYNRQLEDASGDNALEEYENPSMEMGELLRSNALFFNGVSFDEFTRVRVHAPRSYSPGSSIAHLDQTIYAGTEDRLMTPSINGGDVNYDPGVAVQMLYDMGWNTTSIIHQAEFFSEDVNLDYPVLATIRTDSGFDTSSFRLHISTDSFETEDVVSLEYDSSEDEFSYILAAKGENLQYQYYFEVTELSGIRRTVPARADRVYYTFNYGLDTIPPSITGHLPVSSVKTSDVGFEVEVNNISDFFSGVDTSSFALEVRLNGESLDPIPFEESSNEFGNFFKARYETSGFDIDDDLDYRIIVNDKSISENAGTLPEEGFYSVEVQAVSSAIISYENDFNANSSDFSGNGFSITQPSGFEDLAIHSDHPYRNAGEGNTLDFVYELSQPIIIDEANPIMKYREIVIVEPGEIGARCRGADCDLEFWDYVIVEGQKFGEGTWMPFLNGYDSRGNAGFSNAYSNNAPGIPGLYRRRTINLIDNGNFDIGDEVFIRFRLFSDPFATGWGWSIDDLEIQPQIMTNTLEEDYINLFSISPNPVTDQMLKVEIIFSQSFSGVFTVLNQLGQTILYENISNDNRILKRIDTSTLDSGLYTVQLKNSEGISTKSFVKVK